MKDGFRACFRNLYFPLMGSSICIVWKKLCASEKVDLFDLALGLLGFSTGLAKAIFSATHGAAFPLKQKLQLTD